MILLIVITLVYISMLLFPFLLARVSMHPDKSSLLEVKSDNVRDPRYFAKSFGALMEHALDSHDGDGMIRLSKPEKIIEPPLPAGDTIDAVVFSNGNFSPVGALTFEKEIYCRADAVLPERTDLRAIACLGALTLREGCHVSRWADGAHSMTVEPGCCLGLSGSSSQQLFVSTGCTFRRLYAPEIAIGPAGEPLDPPEPAPCKDIHRDITEAGDSERIEGDVISKRSFLMGERAVITGSLKTHGHAHISSGAHILGNLIADGDVVLEQNVFVAGIVFSQSAVYIGPNCQVGRKGRIKSVVARENVCIAEGAQVFGYITGESECATVTGDEYMDMISDKY